MIDACGVRLLVAGSKPFRDSCARFRPICSFVSLLFSKKDGLLIFEIHIEAYNFVLVVSDFKLEQAS